MKRRARARRASDDYGLLGVEVGLHASAQLLDVVVQIVVVLDRGRRRGDGDTLRFKLLGGSLAGLVAAAGHEAEAVAPCGQRRGVECLEELGFSADIGWFGGDELGVGDDRVAIGCVELLPVLPRFELGDRLALGGRRAPRRAGWPRREARRRAPSSRGAIGSGSSRSWRPSRIAALAGATLATMGRPSAWRSRRCRSCHSRSRFSRCWSAARQRSRSELRRSWSSATARNR